MHQRPTARQPTNTHARENTSAAKPPTTRPSTSRPSERWNEAFAILGARGSITVTVRTIPNREWRELEERLLDAKGGLMSDRNAPIIEEFRTHEGRVGGFFEGRTLLLLTHRGARTGTVRTNPLAYRREGDRIFVFGSKGGSPADPDWARNLRANHDVEVEIGTDRYPATVVEIDRRRTRRDLRAPGRGLAAVRAVPAEGRPQDPRSSS